MAEETTALNYVREGGEGEIIEKKSRFICTVRPVETEEEAVAFIAEMKKKYWDARHNCSAFVLGDRQELTRCSDDGEPAGTAGRPMLEVLLGRGIHNAAVVVTRYFGGVLLGTGGLVRAYQNAEQAELNAKNIMKSREGRKLTVGTDYNGVGKLQYLFGKEQIPILDSQYAADVTMEVMIPLEQKEAIEKEITELTSGNAKLEWGDPVSYGMNRGELEIFPKNS